MILFFKNSPYSPDLHDMNNIVLKDGFRSRGYKTFFMLNSPEHETIVGILSFMSKKNSILRLHVPELKTAEFLVFLVFLYLRAFKCHAQLS